MSHELTTVFFWNDSHQEKTLVAASASSESIEIYYAMETRCSRHGSCCTVASHVWYGEPRDYVVEEFAALE